MVKKNGLFVMILLVLIMVMTTGCFLDMGDIKTPVDVSADAGITKATTADEKTTITAEDESTMTEKMESAQPSAEITIAETTLYEKDGVKVTVTGYECGWMGPEIKLLVENDSDKNVLVTDRLVSVNGYMMSDASLYVEVASGKKARESLMLMSSELQQAGIETVAELQFYIEVLDSDNWETYDISELITLGTSAAGLEQPVDDTGDVLFDSKDIKVVCKGLKKDFIWDGTVVFYMENNSKQPVTVYAENVSVNGYMTDASLWSDLRSQTRITDGLSLLDLSDLELTSIDDIKNIEFSLRIVNYENWDEIAVSDVLTLNFE